MLNKNFIYTNFTVLMLTVLLQHAWAAESKEIVYLTQQQFLQQSFAKVPAVRTIWLKGELKSAVSKTLGHDYPALRIRYWLNNQRSAWILDEIGRDKPITMGFVVEDNKLVSVRVLVFRESRGEEIHLPSFTRQFVGAAINNAHQLDRHIDGISGATLSVNATRKLAAVALQLASHLSMQKSSH